MAEIKLSGNKKIGTLCKEFKEAFGATLRVYKSTSCKGGFADPNATLASVRAEGAKGGELKIVGHMQVGNFEKKIAEMYGIGVQVATADDSALASDSITIATAGRADTVTTPTEQIKVTKSTSNEATKVQEVTTSAYAELEKVEVSTKSIASPFLDPFEADMVKIIPGMFKQLSYKDEFYYPGGDKRRKLKRRWVQHSRVVTLSKSYQLCRFPVTQSQWMKIMGEGFNLSEFRGDDLPITNISFDDIMQFIEKLNQLTGKTYRLPTEAEWTWAAMGANKNNCLSKYPGGSIIEELDQYAWYGKNSNGTTHPVGQKKPNGLGLYDMGGNVWECCQDSWCDPIDLGNVDIIDPLEKSNSGFHIMRGGSFETFEGDLHQLEAQRAVLDFEEALTRKNIENYMLKSDYRINSYPFSKKRSCGFRLAL